MDKLGDDSQGALAGDGIAEPSAYSRREFLKKAAGAALALPAAGSVVGSAAALPRSRTPGSRSSSPRRRSGPTRRR